jgi:hypothetical protein
MEGGLLGPRSLLGVFILFEATLAAGKTELGGRLQAK